MHITIRVAQAGAPVLVPAAITSPDYDLAETTIDGTDAERATEEATGQDVFLCDGTRPFTVRHSYRPGSAYPDAIFQRHDSRFTRASEALVADAQDLGTDIPTIARHVAELFHYGHPDTRYYDGHDTVPQLCSMTEGSCVDINLYFIALLREAGIEAGYITGYFFPVEKGNWCEDSHCWVVTRQDGVVQEWDIAHHLKMGTRDIAPGLNPKPGRRAPVAHSMGLTIPAAGLQDIKLMSQPLRVFGGVLDEVPVQIRMEA